VTKRSIFCVWMYIDTDIVPVLEHDDINMHEAGGGGGEN
jgi:hypothetical protein